MTCHREYLIYRRSFYLMVTFKGEAHKGPKDKQKFNIIIESATRGKKCDIENYETIGTLREAKVFVENKLDPKYDPQDKNGQWQPFIFRLDPEGVNCPNTILDVMYQFNIEKGIFSARKRLKDGDEPEIIALFGGLENALAALDHCESELKSK